MLAEPPLARPTLVCVNCGHARTDVATARAHYDAEHSGNTKRVAAIRINDRGDMLQLS